MESLKPPAKRHAWFLAALPASARTVRVLGEPGLAEAVAACGHQLAGASEPADAVLAATSVEDSESVLAGPLDALTAIAIDASVTPRRRPAWRRVLELLRSPLRYLVARRRAGRALGRMESAGPAECLLMSDRSRTIYGLGTGLWRRGLPPVAAVVRSTARPSILEETIAEAGVALDRDFALEGITVRETGKMVAELRDGRGSGYVLRLAAGRSADYVEQAILALTALSSPQSPSALRDHVPELLLDGTVGGARFQIEPRVGGDHPRRLGPELWDDCMEFLVELHNFQRTAPTAREALEASLLPHVELLAEIAGEPAGGALRGLSTKLAERLDGIRLGWGHGDFWRENLFVNGQRLGWVIDWDAATPQSFPLHDLWDILTISRRRGRAWGAGLRCTQVLWPLLREGEEPRTSAYRQATGVPAGRETLGALALAYWITRTTREIEEAPKRCWHRGWIQRNLREPLAMAEQL